MIAVICVIESEHTINVAEGEHKILALIKLAVMASTEIPLVSTTTSTSTTPRMFQRPHPQASQLNLL